MWLSQQFRPIGLAEPSGFGEVTIPQRTAAALTGGREQRLLPIVAPGGYAWTPTAGDRVFVLREGTACILGVQPPDDAPAPGEVLLYSGAASIRLCPNGEIHITGRVRINGTEVGGNQNGE